MTTTETASPGRRTLRKAGRVVGIVAVVLVGVAMLIAIIGSITPWPSALLIRAVFEQSGSATAAEMDRHQPETPVSERLDISYGSDADAAATLDVFTDAAEGQVRPTVVWVHGGAWIAGSSADVDPYLRIIASEGYTAVALNYGLGPESVYPTAVTQLNDALVYLEENAVDLGIDTQRIVLAGDSAGAQLASQLAALTTNEWYADLLGVEPALDPEQVAGVILNCGVYDMRAMAELDGIVAWGFQVALWAYTGTKNWSASYEGATMSTMDFVTRDFPPTYISGGNGDGLTWLQSVPMASALRAVGVPVTDLFWPAQHSPALPHEYQFHLDTPEAQEALEATLDWLENTMPAQAQP